MSEQSSEEIPPGLSKLNPELASQILRSLRENGADLNDPEVMKAVTLTVVSFSDELDKRLREFEAEMGAVQSQMRQNYEQMEAYVDVSAKRMSTISLVFGVLTAIATLVASYAPFRIALTQLLQWLRTSEVFGLSAYAQTVGGVAMLPPAGQLIAPVFVYCVYALLAIGYVVCLFGLFFARQPKDKANAMEILRNLTAFFIGALSGKFV